MPFTHKSKFILLPLALYTLYNHAVLTASIGQCQMVDLLFQGAFCQSCIFTTGEMMPMEGSNLAMGTAKRFGGSNISGKINYPPFTQCIECKITGG